MYGSMGRGVSLARKVRRGTADNMGRPLKKRPFSNKKRTKGRKANENIKFHYTEMMKRLRYIKKLSQTLINNNIILTEEDWKTQVRQYDRHKLLFDDYEKRILFMNVNKQDIQQ